LTKKAKDDPEKYATFWKEHSRVFKMGYGDYENREKFNDLLRFNSSLNEDEKGLTSLDEYKNKMKEGQDKIYYISGPSRAAIELDPLLEVFKKKGIPVLYLVDPVDEFVLSSVMRYKDLDFSSANTKDITSLDKFKDEEPSEKKFEDLTDEELKHFAELLLKMKEILADKVLDVNDSDRLTESAICLVNQEDGFSSTFQKIMRMNNKEMAAPKKVMLVNRNNKLIRNLLSIYKQDANSPYLANMVMQLHEIALMADGDLMDPHALAKRLLHYFEDSSELYAKK
ncbi:MAG: molecular chaperone HtpG, partial [Ignavibacteriales bacterium]|nr:molecular chaperone HtpG [Ignavibacteriales bacterium]